MRNMGQPAAAVRNLHRAVELFDRESGADAIRTLQARSEFAFSLFQQGRIQNSKPLFQSALVGLKRRLGDEYELTIKVTGNYAQTLTTGRAVYWSRSRQELWRKGDTSGHVQRVVSVSIDCDGDALLLKVDQEGPACHTGARSCFDAGGDLGAVDGRDA